MTNARASVFTYVDLVLDPARRTVTCAYRSDDTEFVEVAAFDESVDLTAPGVDELGVLYFLLAGLSYYKTGAAHRIEAPSLGVAQLALLRGALDGGLAEFAYRNALDLSSVELPTEVPSAPAVGRTPTRGPLVPFGGGIDSIVTVESLDGDDVALFVVEPGTGRFEAIERPAATTGRPVVRCERRLDQRLSSPSQGRLEGHVPVTAIVSSLALIAATAQGRDAVLMSNERSASSPTVVVNGTLVNHQWSKSLEAERLLAAAVVERLDPAPVYRSALRSRSELSIARDFAAHTEYFDTFMSCNRAFRQDPARRTTTWCGECDKCLFTDLVLAPFVDRGALEAIFSSAEPLADPARLHQLEVLVGLTELARPFECVGDADECAAALVATAARSDRSEQSHLAALAARCTRARPLAELLDQEGVEVPDAPRDLL